MLIITLFMLAFCDGHVNDFYTEYNYTIDGLIDWL
jgi:prepilin-type processing-associated H-X9-DG protein